jgi:hypothetical protein
VTDRSRRFATSGSAEIVIAIEIRCSKIGRTANSPGQKLQAICQRVNVAELARRGLERDSVSCMMRAATIADLMLAEGHVNTDILVMPMSARWSEMRAAALAAEERASTVSGPGITARSRAGTNYIPTTSPLLPPTPVSTGWVA